MRRNTTILLIGALVAALAIGGLAPVVSAHGGTDTDQPAPSSEAVNATDAQAQYMAEWMAARMGPEGVEAFEEETGTTVEMVSHAMAENMGTQAGALNITGDERQNNPWSANGYQAPNGGFGPQMPAGDGYGHGMWGGPGPGMWGGSGPGMWGGSGPGMWGGFGSGWWSDGSGNGGYGGYGGGGHGMGGHGMGGR